MKPFIFTSLFAVTMLIACATVSAAPPKLAPGLVLTKSAKFPKQVVLLPNAAEDGKGGAITVRGSNIVIDFGGTMLRGTTPTTEPDQRKGTCLLIRGDNITIKNLKAHGYKIGIVADGCKNLKIIGCDLSYNWKQRLKSTPERENLADWMSFHQNEKDEWLRFGAGIYLKNCSDFRVETCKIVGGQCGLMMTRSTGGRVVGNNFSFLSAIGVGLYRSSANTIRFNKIDWCVRGYSHGVYNRGQDSAGILVYEQSNKNVFQYNSVTHGGDGFFLWAGHTTMDTGKGGCNDNYVIGNDFSHAPTNGIEATFSRNFFNFNLVMECWHGLWGGYSYDSEFQENFFGFNAEGIAIEHGQNNRIFENYFVRDRTGINLWQNKTQDPNWAYPKSRDTRSRDYNINRNRFLGLQDAAVLVRDTTNVNTESNYLWGESYDELRAVGDTTGLNRHSNDNDPDNPTKVTYKQTGKITDALIAAFGGTKELLGETVTEGRQSFPKTEPTMKTGGGPIVETEQDTKAYRARFEPLRAVWFRRFFGDGRGADGPLPLPFLPKGALRGRRYIIVDEWGPYDFQSPRLVQREAVAGRPNTYRFEILGPQGKWSVAKFNGGAVVGQPFGSVPGEMVIELSGNNRRAADVTVELEYIGKSPTTDYKGVVTPAGKPVLFGWSRFFLPIAWNVRFFRWDEATTDPRTKLAEFEAMLKTTTPIASLQAERLDLAGASLGQKMPADHTATVAEGTFETPAGRYVLEITTDDGCRAFLDGKPILTSAWKYQGPTLYPIPLDLTLGKHTLRIEHFQIDGYATLQANLKPIRAK